MLCWSGQFKDCSHHPFEVIRNNVSVYSQLCSPVQGKDWYILVAAQEWNSYMNVVYQAVGFAMTMMQGNAKHTFWFFFQIFESFLQNDKMNSLALYI